MKFDETAIKKIYTAPRLPKGYDKKPSSLKGIVRRALVALVEKRLLDLEGLKRQAIEASSLKEGDRVMVFCCGTGYDFPHILRKIGDRGSIVGVDFSPAMLARAQAKIDQEKWKNVELIEADVTEFANRRNDFFDAGLCTLGMSIIPQWERAYRNLLSHVRSAGEVIIGDLQLASGWKSVMNPLVIGWAKGYGGSYKGHRNSHRLFALMAGELSDVRKRIFFFDSYGYCVGRKK
jgi:demethylmenaquinone methyltransferase/2-methoxy-6-polyprenyl-1,4-benzoquinol methylase